MGVEIVKASVESEHALYRFFGTDGQLLYVGISLHPFQRMGQHRGEKSWWGEVATVTIERHSTRGAALEAERAAIKAERPRYNVVHAGARKGKPRTLTRFTYWEPAIGGLLTVCNVWPDQPARLRLKCVRCMGAGIADRFTEMPHGEIQCEATCPECGGLMLRVIPPPGHPLLLARQGGA